MISGRCQIDRSSTYLTSVIKKNCSHVETKQNLITDLNENRKMEKKTNSERLNEIKETDHRE